MSKQSDAKSHQGYIEKCLPSTCSNCANFEFEQVIQTHAFGQFTRDKNLRCKIGGFAVKKMATCGIWKPHNPTARKLGGGV